MPLCPRCASPVTLNGALCGHCACIRDAAGGDSNSPPPPGGDPPPVARPLRHSLAFLAGVLVTMLAHLGPFVSIPVELRPAISLFPSVPNAAAAPGSFATLYSQDRSGVVRIYSLGCPGEGTGAAATGFLLAPNLIATTAHVVANSAAIGLTVNHQTAVGQIIGYDPAMDLALVRSSVTFRGHRFSLSDSQPSVGSTVGMIGFPLDHAMSFISAPVSGLDRSISIAPGLTLTGLIQAHVYANPGNSGAPVLNAAGAVVGLDETASSGGGVSGTDYLTPSTEAAPEFAQWRKHPQTVPPATCPTSSQPFSANRLTVYPKAQGPEATGVALTLSSYFAAVDASDFHTAQAQFAPPNNKASDYARFYKGIASTQDSAVTLHSLTPTGPDRATAWLTFTSNQDASEGPQGLTCTHWSLDYVMTRIKGVWMIGGTHRHGKSGPGYSACA